MTECRNCLVAHDKEDGAACLRREVELRRQELRRQIWDDVPIRLHDSLPSSELVEVAASVYDPDTEKWKPDWTRMESLLDVGYGQSYAAAFVTRLGHSEAWGSRELALASILETADMCRSRHQSDLHRSPGRTSSLCERILRGLAEHGDPLGQVTWREREKAQEWHYTGWDEITEEYVLLSARQGLRHAAAYRHRELHRYMRTARERERDSRVDCPACLGRVVIQRRRVA